jgi:hypothetical protein
MDIEFAVALKLKFNFLLFLLMIFYKYLKSDMAVLVDFLPRKFPNHLSDIET